MIRMRISLTKDEYVAAKHEAARLGISLAEFLRRSLRAALPVKDDKPWMRYAGMVETGDPASSRHIDDMKRGGRSKTANAAAAVRLKKRGKGVVAVPDSELPALTAEEVRDTLERVRR